MNRRTIRLGSALPLAMLLLGGALWPSPAAAQPTVVATVPLPSRPIAVGVNPVTNRIYVTTGHPSNNISVIDGRDSTVIATVWTAGRPTGVGVNPVTNRIYVATNLYPYGNIEVIDGRDNTVIARVPVVLFPDASVAVNPVTNLIYVVTTPATLSVIDGRDNTVVATYDLSVPTTFGNSGVYTSGIPAVSVNPVTNRIHVAVPIVFYYNSGTPSFRDYASSVMKVIDGSTHAVVATFGTGSRGPIAVNPVTNQILFSSIRAPGCYPGNGSLVAYDGSTYRTVSELSYQACGGYGYGLGVNPVTNRIYVHSSSNSYGMVAVIDGRTNSLAAILSVGAASHTYNFVGVNPNTNRVYVPNSNSVLVIEDVVAPTDTTPPVITPTVTGTLGNNGWYTSDVSVSWSVTDPDSAISASSGCGSSTVTADTAGTTFTCTATSAGGPASESVTVARDATLPTITGSPSPNANANGWNTTDVTVSFACADNLSGVATCASDITLSADGASQSVSGNAVTDLAGNTASTTVSNIHIDKTAPTITASRTPPANGAGWNNTDVTVTFTCSDPVSGLAGPCPPPETLTAEGAGQSRDGTVADLAGNSASLTVSDINIDKTAPTITGSRTPAANAAGWNNTDVTVTFACDDLLSGVPAGACGPSPQTVTSEGVGQSRTGTVADLAGNTASTSVGSIHIDKTPPVIVILTPTMDSLIASSPVTVQVQAADAMGVSALSVNSVPAGLLAGGTPQSGTWQATVAVTLPVPVGGALTFTATAGDLAGNLTVATTVVDNDGIDAAIDTQPQAHSNDFSDLLTGGTTSGTITSRGGWTVHVKDVNSGGVDAVVTGTGTTATLSTCAAGGAERVELDGAGETASVECVTTTDVNTGSTVTAINATSPTGNPKILVRDASGKVKARLSTGQWMTIGSPVTAGSTNSEPIAVELLDEDRLVFASFLLAASESVDVSFATGANDVEVVHLTVLVGTIDFTVGTRTVTLGPGQAGTFPTDVWPPTIANADVTPKILWPPNHKMVDVAVSYQVTDNRDPAPVCSLSVASNEPLNGTGDGDTSPDWVVVDARRLQLRAERAGTGPGRVYTVTVTCGDASGNLATRPLAVTVPKNQR